MMRWFWPLSHLGSWWLDLSTWQYMIKLINLAVDEGMILHHWSTWRLMMGMKQWWWRGPLVVKENGHVKWPFVLEWWWRLTASHMWRETSFHVMMVRDSFPCDDGERQFPIGQWIDHWICGSIQEGEGGEDNILSQRGLSVLMNSIAPAPDLPNNLTVLFQRKLVIPSWCTESRQLLTLRWIERTNSAHFYDDEAVMVIGVHYSSQHYGNVFTEIDFLNFALVPLDT